MSKHKSGMGPLAKRPSYKPGPDPVVPETESKCPHCQATAHTGMRGGCQHCGKVKHSSTGKQRM